MSRSTMTTPAALGMMTLTGTHRNTQAMNQTSNLSEADNIKVAVRVRPLFEAEKHDKGAVSVLQVTEDHTTIKLLDAALSGYNVTIFAYGQTGSGKTFTMSGREEVIVTDNYQGGDRTDGIITRSVHHLYHMMREKKDMKYALSASVLEIYNEAIFDLLNLKAKNLPIKWDAADGFNVPGLKTVDCSRVDQMMEVIRTGMKHRHVGSHELNIESSRSHSIMTINCCATSLDPEDSDYGTQKFGKICFVDLAGSERLKDSNERLKDSKCEGTMMKETANINKSLFVLGKN
eukprot:gene16524-22754_t